MPLDPTLKRLLNSAYLKGFGELHHLSIDQMRRLLSHPNPKIEMLNYQEFQLDEVVKLRLYPPKNVNPAERLPAVLYIPATGFIVDRLEASNHYCSLLADKLHMKVFSLSHRLIPEYQFPSFLHDALAAIQWIDKHADQLTILPTKIAIWGESSGATIAASSTHALRNQGLTIIKHQTLFYPMVDLVNTFPSKEQYQEGCMLDQGFLQWLDGHGFLPAQCRRDPYISPLLSPDFTGLPPATLITAELDPLRDEGEAYGEKLRSAAIAVKTLRVDGMIHGFMRFYRKVFAAQKAMDFACAALKEAFY